MQDCNPWEKGNLGGELSGPLAHWLRTFSLLQWSELEPKERDVILGQLNLLESNTGGLEMRDLCRNGPQKSIWGPLCPWLRVELFRVRLWALPKISSYKWDPRPAQVQHDQPEIELLAGTKINSLHRNESDTQCLMYNEKLLDMKDTEHLPLRQGKISSQ